MDNLRISGSGNTAQGSLFTAAPASSAQPATVASGPDGVPASGAGAAAKSARQQATATATAAAQHAVPKPAPDANGTQMVLVFDDQTHAMTVMMLDIVTQRVQQPFFPGTAPASASATATAAAPATGTATGTPTGTATGTFINTKA